MPMEKRRVLQLTPEQTDEMAAVITQAGTPAFPQAISEFCKGLSGADEVFLSAFFDNHKPAELYYSGEDPAAREALSLYLGYAYLLDPFYPCFRSRRGGEVLRMCDIAPDDYRRSEYYSMFYKTMGLEDECGLMIFIEEGAALFFSIGTHGKGRRLSLTRLSAAVPVITALARRHWLQLNPESTDGGSGLAAQLEEAFGNFGASLLSPREQEIARLILRGHSSKAMARMFDCSPETVKVHRKRLYAKLNLNSQGELLSLFLRALANAPADAAADPLESLPEFTPGA
jgi:DNA-binding CsgD family transcriptional regulator